MLFEEKVIKFLELAHSLAKTKILVLPLSGLRDN